MAERLIYVAPEQTLLVGVVRAERACKLLGCGRDRLNQLIDAGEIESYLEDARRKVTLRSIAAYIDRRLAADRNKRQKSPRVRAGRTAGGSPS